LATGHSEHMFFLFVKETPTEVWAKPRKGGKTMSHLIGGVARTRTSIYL